MCRKVRGHPRPAALVKIGPGRRTRPCGKVQAAARSGWSPAGLPHAPRDQILLDQVHHAVGEGQLDGDLRVPRREVGNRRRQELHAESRRRIKPQYPTRRGLLFAGGLLGLLEVGEKVRTPLVIAAADLG